MSSWITGLISSVVLLMIAVITYLIWASFGLVLSAIALLCAAIAAAFVLAFIYAVENDDFKAGASIPLIAAFGLAVGYFGQPPLEQTLALCALGSVLAVVLIQEGD